MANEKARNQTDALFVTATFALSATAGSSVTSAAIDLGTDVNKPENVEVELVVPALTSVMNPAASTAGVTYLVESSTTSTFAAVARTIVSKNIAGSTGPTAATNLRCRLPSDCERYIRGKMTLGATGADSSAVSAYLALRF